ncbi:hypothetical protein SMICM17S_07444 [Streptomyces microflavus]
MKLGIGIGWRPEIAAEVEALTGIDWVEAVAENLCADHLPGSLVRLRERGVTVVPHGVSLGLGGADRPDAGRLAGLAARAELLGTPLVTEHIAFVRAGGPLTATPRAGGGPSAAGAAHLGRAGGALRERPDRPGLAALPLALENIAALISWPDEELTEGQFLAELVERARGGTAAATGFAATTVWCADAGPRTHELRGLVRRRLGVRLRRRLRVELWRRGRLRRLGVELREQLGRLQLRRELGRVQLRQQFLRPGPGTTGAQPGRSPRHARPVLYSPARTPPSPLRIRQRSRRESSTAVRNDRLPGPVRPPPPPPRRPPGTALVRPPPRRAVRRWPPPAPRRPGSPSGRARRRRCCRTP